MGRQLEAEAHIGWEVSQRAIHLEASSTAWARVGVTGTWAAGPIARFETALAVCEILVDRS